MLLLLALLAGAASAFAFQPAGLWPLLPLAFAALLELLSRAPTRRRALLTGFLFGLGQFAISLNWIATAFTFQAAMPAWLGWVAVLLVALYLALFPALAAGLAWAFGEKSRLVLVLGLAGAWGITEWLRAGLFTGFAWNPAGVVLVDTPLLGVSALIGTYGLSLLVVLLGGALWLAAHRRWGPVAGIAAATVLLWAFPAPRIPASLEIKPLRIVQPDIEQEDKWRPGLADEAFERLGRLSAGGAPVPRLLFWPEVAVPVPFQIIGTNGQSLPVLMAAVPRAMQSVRPGDLLVTGAVTLVADDRGAIVGNTNSVLTMAADGGISGRYDKAHLVPYGEYLPMRPLLSAIGLSKLAPGQGDTGAGPGPRTLDVPGFARMGVQICYEIIFSGEVVERANRPDFLFNPSNDAWFGRWGPPQHLAQARLRAAEEGLPVVRSTPTGISALIDARGGLVKALPWRTAGVIDADLPPPAASPPPFARLGNWIPLGLAFALLFAAIALSARRRYRPI
ncbi:apolipoprotein N-acyltransferase [Sphingomonas sp.]|uniref:apolipoprotein N-acyltransferase n=1 Tax=Sphingomonas sp. TaxID=28214 RepID=UPI00286D9548|nr:apolipoprotein N-acyltransferase [Sphingomonas sp.]